MLTSMSKFSFCKPWCKCRPTHPRATTHPTQKKTTELLKKIGYIAEQFPVPEAEVKAYGLTSLTNLIVRNLSEQAAKPLP
jgi:hypothetical protein